MGNFAENLNLGNRVRPPPANFENFESALYSTSGSMPLKTIAIMTSQTQNFLIFWLLILDSKSFQIIF